MHTFPSTVVLLTRFLLFLCCFCCKILAFANNFGLLSTEKAGVVAASRLPVGLAAVGSFFFTGRQ